MSATGSAELAEPLLGFAAVLREEGVAAPAATTALAAQALASLEPSPERGYWALRSVFAGRAEDLEPFDRAYARFWLQAPPVPPRGRGASPPAGGGGDAGKREPAGGPSARFTTTSGSEDGGDNAVGGVRASSGERLGKLDFADYGPGDLEAARREMDRVVRRLPKRTERRLRARGSGARIDLRRTMLEARRTGGVPLRRRWRARRRRPLKLVLLLDVSGSMRAYSGAFMTFALAAMRVDRRIETFAFGTRLTRITEQLRLRPDGRALAAASAAVPDWSGGTRIGENLRSLNERWGDAGLTRGAIVVVLSDGWEHGDPELLDAELTRLRRTARALVWINPLAGVAGYEPLAAGMAAALPNLDRFLPGNDLRALDVLSREIAALSGQSIGAS